MGSTNYINTFVQVADDCPVQLGEQPPEGGKSPTVAALQYALIANRPYELTSDDLLFEVFAARKAIPDEERSAARGVLLKISGVLARITADEEVRLGDPP